MTKNQIEYLKVQESRRSNLRQEELTAARDATSRELGFATLGETTRHNQATEAHNTAVLGESQRHNIAQERHNSLVLGEQTRANMAREALERSAQEETKRHNVTVEMETSRHNIASENIQSEANQISLSRAEEEKRSNLAREAETLRSNQARESETYRSNVAREQETFRSNVAREQETARINRDTIAQREKDRELGYAQLSETSRYHTQTISLGYSQLAETQRSHLATEAEQHRANVAQEGLTKSRDIMTFEENVRSHVVAEEISKLRAETEAYRAETEAQRVQLQVEQLGETRRHNQATEGIMSYEEGRKTIEGLGKLIPLFLS